MKKIDVRTFLDIKYVNNPALSPDGSRVVFAVTKANEKENNYSSNLFELNLATKAVRQLTSGDDAGFFCFLPDGDLLLGLKRTKEDKEEAEKTDENPDGAKSVFYRLSREGGEALKAFELPLLVTGVKPLSDSLYVISAQVNLGQPQKDRAFEIIEESPFWFNGQGFTEGLRTQLFLYRPATGELEAVTEKGFDASLDCADETKIIYSGTRWEKGMHELKSGVYVYDIASKQTRCLVEPGKEFVGVLDFAPAVSEEEKGKKLLLGRFKEGANMAMSNQDFWTMDLKSGEMKFLCEFDRSIGGSVGSDARQGHGHQTKLVGDKFYFVSTLDESAKLLCLSADGTLSDPLTPDGSVDGFDANEGHVVTMFMAENGVNELYLDGEQVTHFNDELLSGLSISKPEYHEWTNENGDVLHGYVMPPVGPDGKNDEKVKDGKYPAILHIHGGPATVFGAVLHHEMQLWANAGFYVIYMNPRGSDGRGAEFMDISDKYGTIDYEDIMNYLDAMLELYPEIDRERLGVTGGSYGGFMTNWVIGHTNRFKAACAQRSIANWTAFEHTSDIGPLFTEHHQGATTRTDLLKLWEHSPLKAAPNCVTPTLFIHSDQDYRCWMVEGISMFNALQMNGCDARLVLFHGETHDLSRSGKPKNRIKRMEEILAWMEKYLKA